MSLSDDYPETGKHEREDQEPEPVVGDPPPSARTLLSNRAYDVLRWVAQIFLPAAGTLYAAVGGLWGAPAIEEVVGTIVAVDLFLGAILGVSSRQYQNSDARYDGEIKVVATEDKDVYSLDLKGEPEDLQPGKDAVFKIVKT